MTTEAKVGAFTLAGLALFAAVALMLSGFSLGKGGGYTLYAGFKQVVGIEPQTQVRISGVPAGEVLSVKNDGGGVTVAMHLNGEKVPRGSRVTVASAGVMGEKFINIIPAGVENGYLADGDYLIGEEESGMDSVMVNIDKALGQVQELLASMNAVFGNKEMQQSLVKTMMNVQEITARMDAMMSVMESLTVENKGQMQAMLTHMNETTAALSRTMTSVEHMMANLETVGADPQTAENLRLTLQNIADASGRVVKITESLEKVTGDEEVQKDLKETIHNAKELTGRANGMLGKLEDIEVKPSVDVLYSGGADDWKTDFDIDIEKEGGGFLRLGADDIGGDSRLNAQVGKRRGSLGFRGGVVNGEAGVGVDIYAGPRATFSAEGYAPDDMKLRLEAAYDITGDGTSIVGQWDKVNDAGERAAYVGLRQAF